MDLKNGAQEVKVIPGRHIVFSAGTGRTTVSEIQWLTDTVVRQAAAWKITGWGYIAHCLNMDPVTPDVGGELVTLHKTFVENGCKAFAFIDGSSAMLKAQAKSHQKRSSTDSEEGHFCSTEEALEWFKQLSL